jgi:hypothetical protein
MAFKHQLLSYASKQHHLCQKITVTATYQTFANGSPKSGMAGQIWRLTGAEWTLNPLSLIPYGGHGMVLQHHLLSHASKQHQLLPKI